MERQTKKPARRSGWRQWTADEGRRAVEAWQASGLPLETFARQRGVTAQRIRWWRQRLDGRGEAGAGGEEELRPSNTSVTCCGTCHSDTYVTRLMPSSA
jgi:transposase-like protein